ncbi:hypothetical protein BB560_001560 [Smittium megazygosporum]|uniref:RCC1-like domain-containing protein n=1 Tax=Smittium megazygosporum TaxID=133381 RepID=A0A2T9ZHF0_9FUNG|nr:hypothetical protein BB560_001560 [Smittium megazygosporum]
MAAKKVVVKSKASTDTKSKTTKKPEKKIIHSKPEINIKKRPRAALEPRPKRIKVRKTTLNPVHPIASQSGTVLTFGNGDCGQLGLGEDKPERKKPFPIQELVDQNIVDIASGGLHSIALTKEGKLWSWGCNDQKALGRAGDEYVPMHVEQGDSKFIKVECGDSVSVALTSDGYVYSWGTFRSSDGIMGYSKDVKIQDTPTLIKELSKEFVIDLAAGVDHVLALTTAGTVYCWGNGQQYQLGRKILGRHKLNCLLPAKLGLKNIVSIGAGAYHSFAIDKKGVLYSWGLNNFGQCGAPSSDLDGEPIVEKPTKVDELKDRKIVKVSGGEHHSLAMDDQGNLFSFGRSDSSQTGLPESLILAANAENGENSKENSENSPVTKSMVPSPTMIPDIPKIIDFAVGSNHNLAISEDKKLLSWGYGEMLQCGNGEEEDVKTPTIVTGKNIDGKSIIKVSAGGQHSVLLVQ